MRKEAEGAQNQHYVPKFILRNFLSDEAKERVAVFSKSAGKGFVTSIKNIMAERRFHDFAIDDEYMASFEEAVCRIEDQLLPTYRRIVKTRRLERTESERASLALFISFQLMRTRSHRDQLLHVEKHLEEHLEKIGGKLEDLEGGYKRLDENSLKQWSAP